ncbi:hypothetical protein [Rahnella selenatireducens]|uniref:hypothetical protein n=1 Tax=Rahnella selenatireducens TaxID=3389797 RepID=UPI00396947A3
MTDITRRFLLCTLGSGAWVATQTGLKERLSPRPLRIPGSFTARYRWLALFQQRWLVPQTPPLRGTFASGSNLLEKRLSLFLTTLSTSF